LTTHPSVSIVLMLGLVGAIAAALPALGEPPAASGPPTALRPAAQRQDGRTSLDILSIDAGTGRVIQLRGAAASVFAADPKVAEVRPASATSLFVFGVAPGRTTVAALDAAGAPIAQYDVVVKPSSYGAGEAQAAIARALPGTAVKVETLQNGLAVTGTVKTAADADRVMQLVRGYLPTGQTADNRLSVVASIQVNLRVRIAEISRNLVRQLGFNWEALGNIGTIGKFPVFPALTLNVNNNQIAPIPNPRNPLNLGGNFNAIIDALAQDELVHILAQPNLTAISGEAASFLVGGEFPIPVAQQNNQTTIEFKQFGVSLAFVPTVSSDGQITLKVRPEVSQLSTQNNIQLAAGSSVIVVPSLTVRRAETTVQLGSGETFAIAGLLQDSANVGGSGLPILGDLPILGALFRSDKFQRNETELIIVVTPYIVRPVADATTVRLPTDGWQPPTDLERILWLRQSGRTPIATGTAARSPIRIPGSAGFVVQ
jgi:pilus assembly protein CpaC